MESLRKGSFFGSNDTRLFGFLYFIFHLRLLLGSLDMKELEDGRLRLRFFHAAFIYCVVSLPTTGHSRSFPDGSRSLLIDIIYTLCILWFYSKISFLYILLEFLVASDGEKCGEDHIIWVSYLGRSFGKRAVGETRR